MELETHGGFLQWCEGHIHHLQPQLSALFPGCIQWQTALQFIGNPCRKCQNISVQSAHIALPIYRIVDYWKTDQREVGKKKEYDGVDRSDILQPMQCEEENIITVSY